MTVTAEQYLVIDRAAEFRHELLDGKIVALPGGNIRHAQLRMNLIGELRARIRGLTAKSSAAIFVLEFPLACILTRT